MIVILFTLAGGKGRGSIVCSVMEASNTLLNSAEYTITRKEYSTCKDKFIFHSSTVQYSFTLPQVYLVQQLCRVDVLTVLTRWAGQAGGGAHLSWRHTFLQWGQQPAISMMCSSPSSSVPLGGFRAGQVVRQSTR